MKNTILTLSIVLLLLSCGKDEKLAFETKNFSNSNCVDCPEIDIEIPMALDNRKISTTVNSAIREEAISLLTFEEEKEIVDIPTAISSFNNGYLELLKKFPDETIPWEASIVAVIAYENEDLLTIKMNSYIFTGGAHGYGSTRFLNFDKKSGIELNRKDLFKNHGNFVDFAEKLFREQQNIPSDQSINSTGLMFELDEFYLPENIGFTESGLNLLYNPYEIASYADGTIEMVIPYEEIQKFLAVRL